MIDISKSTSTNAAQALKEKEEQENNAKMLKKTKYKAANNAVRKVIILGDAGVGKTSLKNRVLSNSFMKNVEPTIGSECFDLNLQISSSSKNMILRIWDISGQDQYMSLTTMYYRDTDAAILVYDVTD